MITKTNQTIEDTNLTNNRGEIDVVLRGSSAGLGIDATNWWNIPYKKYQIKESDMRIKTATFTSNAYIDLTLGSYAVRIRSPAHENFLGIILNVEEDENGLYNYQCQDWSRNYNTPIAYYSTNVSVYQCIRNMMTNCEIGDNPNQQTLNNYKKSLSGLRPIGQYEQSLWGSTIKFNPMTAKFKLFKVDEVSDIETLRTLIYGSGAYIDVYFNDKGYIQIEPYHKKDFFETGLRLTRPETLSQKRKFDLTNIITRVRVKSNKALEKGTVYFSNDLVNLNLELIVGKQGVLIDNPNPKSTITTSTTSSNTSKTSTTTKQVSNPYGTKKKAVWINADGGSGTIKNQLANALRKKGWSVKVSGTGPSWHYTDYFRCSSGYVLMMVMNGFCAGSMREAYSTKIQNVLKKKGVVLVPVWHTAGWTNPRGMKPYRYGDFSGYSAKRAWDDNFSRGNPGIKNVGQWLKSVGAKYCCHPTLNGIMNQFLAGGYFATKK